MYEQIAYIAIISLYIAYPEVNVQKNVKKGKCLLNHYFNVIKDIKQ